MAINRRQFLQRAGATGGALAAAAALPACHTVFPIGYKPRRTMLEPAGGGGADRHHRHRDEENRSFDHWLGWLGSARGVPRVRTQPVRQVLLRQREQPADVTTSPTGPQSHPAHGRLGRLSNPYQGCDLVGPEPRLEQRSGATRPRLPRAGPRTTTCSRIGYYEGADLPFTQQFVKRFTTFDDYHCSLLGPTYPNREYLHSRAVGREHVERVPVRSRRVRLADHLGQARRGRTFRSATTTATCPFLSLFGSRTHAVRQADRRLLRAVRRRHAAQRRDGRPGLPRRRRRTTTTRSPTSAPVSRSSATCSRRSPSPRSGSAARSSRRTTSGAASSTTSRRRTSPTTAPTPTTCSTSRQAGFRVPTILASPYAHHGLVDHRTYDHTSILRFLEWRFLGAPPEGPGAARRLVVPHPPRPLREQHRRQPAGDARRCRRALRHRHADRSADRRRAGRAGDLSADGALGPRGERSRVRRGPLARRTSSRRTSRRTSDATRPAGIVARRPWPRVPKSGRVYRPIVGSGDGPPESTISSPSAPTMSSSLSTRLS